MDMTELQEVVKEISEGITRLEQLKEESPQVQEALSIQARQEALVKRLQEGCKEQIPQPVPYPVYPYPIPMWQPQVITTNTTDTKKLTTQVAKELENRLRAHMGTM